MPNPAFGEQFKAASIVLFLAFLSVYLVTGGLQFRNNFSGEAFKTGILEEGTPSQVPIVATVDSIDVASPTPTSEPTEEPVLLRGETVTIGNMDLTGYSKKSSANFYAGNKRIAQKDSSGIAYVHGDSLDNSVVLTDAAGNEKAASRISYDAFGSPSSASALFTGIHNLDTGTGLYYMKARFYDPTNGRFTSPDMLAGNGQSPQTLNRYSYVVNNPIRFTDPTGNQVMDEALVKKISDQVYDNIQQYIFSQEDLPLMQRSTNFIDSFVGVGFGENSLLVKFEFLEEIGKDRSLRVEITDAFYQKGYALADIPADKLMDSQLELPPQFYAEVRQGIASGIQEYYEKWGVGIDFGMPRHIDIYERKGISSYDYSKNNMVRVSRFKVLKSGGWWGLKKVFNNIPTGLFGFAGDAFGLIQAQNDPEGYLNDIDARVNSGSMWERIANRILIAIDPVAHTAIRQAQVKVYLKNNGA
ncbi:MAG: RHS repeat-associated core domain-containing protein [Candidatus Micrarchaeota archaeon]